MSYRGKHRNIPEKNKWVILLLIILIASIGVTVWAVFFRNTTPTLAPDYAPREREENAEPFDDGDSEKMEQQEGGGAVNLTYSKEVSVDLSDGSVNLMFANPKRSNQSILLQVVVHDTVIVQSGLLEPGYQLTKLALWDNAKLSAGDYDGKLVILFYQPDSGEKAMINTEIPVIIKVTE